MTPAQLENLRLLARSDGHAETILSYLADFEGLNADDRVTALDYVVYAAAMMKAEAETFAEMEKRSVCVIGGGHDRFREAV